MTAAIPRNVLLAMMCVGVTLAGAGVAGAYPAGPPPIGTLVYAVTRCSIDDATGVIAEQEVRVQHGYADPVTVVRYRLKEIAAADLTPNRRFFLGAICQRFGHDRAGGGAELAAPVNRVDIDPNGATIVFHVSDDAIPLNDPPFEADIHVPSGVSEGFYAANTDGSELRFLGHEVSVPPVVMDKRGSSNPGDWVKRGTGSITTFQPDGKAIAYVDVDDEPGSPGDGRLQVMLLDVRTGKRTQVTDLVTPTCRPTVGSLEVFYPLFVDERTIRFSRNVAKSDTDPCELGKDNYVIEQCTVRTNGSRLRCTPTPIFNGLPIQTGEPELAIQGKHVSLVTVDVAPAEGARQAITEIFAKRGRQISQLTHLGSSDTRPRSLTRNERLVLFTTAANPFGTNPGNRCELFSMNIRGGGMKQVTNFNHDPAIPADQIKNGKGCSTGGDFGCTIGKVLLDPRTKALVFMSNCDLLGTGVSGEQAFAMWPDGSGLTQITHAAGCRGVCKVDPLTTLPTSVELPGYMSYAPVPPRKRR